MFTEFRYEIDQYLGGLIESPVRTLAEVVAFNEAHAEAELRWHRRTPSSRRSASRR